MAAGLFFLFLISSGAYAEQINRFGGEVDITYHHRTYKEMEKDCASAVNNYRRGDFLMGCAYWNRALTRCDVYITGKVAWVKEHEERHCREGAFH